MNWDALFLSLKLAAVVCAILLLIGLPIAYWIAFSSSRARSVVESIVALPLVLPPTVLGFYVLVALGNQSPLGRLYQSWSGHPLPFTFQGLVVASVIYSLPFTVQPIAASFSMIDRNLLDASAILGASRMRTFARIVLPLSMGGVVTAVVLSFAHTMGEFGVVLMVGGNIAGVTRTVSVSIYDQVEALNYGAATETSLVLVG
ncbi:MAG TPA: molybdate ABC transporter permease subunit, partial [Candidatus Binataceae bacterium]|nr:molybdate ABC transporter permease subunit [Candidatus Binataceae bacterium]